MPRQTQDPSAVQCTTCGHQNTAGERFCSECGTAAIAAPTQPLARRQLICRACGAESPIGKKFCGQCGHQLIEGGTEPARMAGATASAVPTGIETNGLLRPGAMLQERYKITKLIGQGGMGAIYLASDTRFANKSCVLKEMLDHFADPEQRRLATESFHREADMLASLCHEGIPEVFDRFTESNRHYLVMEFIDGIDLEQKLIGEGKVMAEADVLSWGIQICDLLSYLHHRDPSVIYRDMKPANLILSKSGRIYMVDFGIARFFNPNSRGTMIGTQGYAPPEQYRGQVEPRSDLYALAATLHHLLTERDPQTEAPFSFPPVRALNPEVSPETDALIARGLENDLEKRFASADAMLDAMLTITKRINAKVKVCPYCHRSVPPTKQLCPHCKSYVADRSGSVADTREIIPGSRLLTNRLAAWEQNPWWVWATVLTGMIGLVTLGIFIGLAQHP